MAGEFPGELGAAIQASVGCDPNLAIESERLEQAGGLVSGSKRGMRQADLTARPGTFSVGAAEEEGLGHSVKKLAIDGAVFEIKNAGKATHARR